ncbi:hypothetical protein PC9H_009258 [Pleurotus ostreatus]|uniref:C2H2-type domain-containing protein n=1 Tax=Pleurotus ostreatus TaxID=5322 RepID=A0A8H7DQH9_PLEOS|nr:uncharacterized protein PC9H_009258 [Pleurotus ostreatus]KAF7423958.1 hypothetical protein PC9H_009258 [Pleurotus ostreatus]
MNHMKPDYNSQYELYNNHNHLHAYQASDSSTSSNLPDSGCPDPWSQSPISPTMPSSLYNMGQIQHYPSYLPTTPSYHHAQPYDQQFYMTSPGIQSQGSNFLPTDDFTAVHHHYHPEVQSYFNPPGGIDNRPPVDCQWINSLPFVQHGSLEPQPSTTSPSVTRQLATDAVSDAAEKRRVNPHRFFCQYCDRGFTARHNYTRHLGAHNDVRPFGCECGSAFTTKSDLKRHQLKSKKHGNAQTHATECSQ